MGKQGANFLWSVTLNFAKSAHPETKLTFGDNCHPGQLGDPSKVSDMLSTTWSSFTNSMTIKCDAIDDWETDKIGQPGHDQM